MRATKIILSVFFVLVALAVSAGAKPLNAAEPSEPNVGLLEGTMLVNLARTTMDSYLIYRTPAASIAIPKKLEGLAGRSYGVSLGLRNRGKLLARSIVTERSLGENLIAAALQTMRCESLPDRITKSYLDSLMIEVEVLGPCKEVEADDFGKAFQPGLTGLKLSRGNEVNRILPSTVYLLRLDAAETVRKCMLGLPGGAGDTSSPTNYEVFATRHFVGYPDETVMALYRGKSLMPFDAIDDTTISFAAHRIAAYLLTNQDSDGRYNALGSKTSLRDHLHAAYAMGRLWQLTQEQRYSRSLAKAVQYAKEHVRWNGESAYVFTMNSADQLAATAWLVIVLNETGAKDYEPALQAGLLRSLADNANAGKDKLPAAAMDGSDCGPAAPKDASLAYFALAAYGKDEQAKQAAQSLNSMLADIAPEDAETRLWFAWTCVYANNPDKKQELKLSFVRKDNHPDELGGLLCNDELTPTHVSALAATVATVYPQLWSNSEQAEELAAAARKFCYQMIYKPREAYTELNPSDLVGAVRAEAGSARVSLQACAAVIEAFMAVPPAARQE